MQLMDDSNEILKDITRLFKREIQKRGLEKFTPQGICSVLGAYSTCECMYVCMYLCMYVCMHVCRT